jgi:ribosomal protein L30E
MKGDGKGNFKVERQDRSGIFSLGAVRDMKVLNVAKHKVVLIAKNNDKLQIVQFK